MKDSKNIVIGMLCAVVCIMAVAYAAFSTTLTINGTATISSNWSVLIPENGVTCNVQKANGGADKVVVDGEDVLLAATGTATGGTTASFEMTFLQPGDSATCTVTIANQGTLAAKVSSLEITGNDEEGPIKFAVSGIAKDDTLAADDTTTFTITGTYDANVTSQPTGATSKTLTVTAVYVQDTAA